MPQEIFQLKSVTELFFMHSQVRIVLPQIGQLENLKHLSLHNNQLTSLPSEICHLTLLEELDLMHNQLETLPLCMGEMSLLRGFKSRDVDRLWIAKNPLSSIPDHIVRDGGTRVLHYLRDEFRRQQN